MQPADASYPQEPLRARVDDTGDEQRRAVAKITLAAVLGSEKRQGDSTQMSRTLLDVIREEQNQNNTKKSWKNFKARLLLRHAGGAWTSSVHVPTSDIPMRSTSKGNIISRQQSTRFPTEGKSDDPESLSPLLPPAGRGSRGQMSRMSSTRFPKVRFALDEDAGESTHDDSDESAESDQPEEREQSPTEAEEEGKKPERMSLMSLLGPTYEEDEEEDEEDGGSDDDGDYGGGGNRGMGEVTCCVCMVRHKGAAFVPCGHAFCRLCSRELWVSKGNCPLCNGFILEVLDIF